MKRKGERLITYQKIEAFGQWLESCERNNLKNLSEKSRLQRRWYFYGKQT